MSSELTPTPELLAGLWNRMRVSEHGMKHTCYYEFFDWHAAELRKAKAEALREAADDLDHCTEADVNNAIGRPSPTYKHSQRYADVYWLHTRADQIEEDHQERKDSIMDYAGIWGPRPEGLDVVEWQREIRDEQ